MTSATELTRQFVTVKPWKMDPRHVLFETTDKDRPSSICDSNGEVVLGLCKLCGRGEVELCEPCVPYNGEEME